jgi:glycosyltransferase involved in cell wall biosynthesis
VYNSVNLTDYPFIQHPKNYLVWLGKVNPNKGTKEAILAAKEAGMPIHVMGKVDPGAPQMMSYYEQEIKPLLSLPHIFWHNGVSVKEKASILGNAHAMLNPIQWEEPFGLVMVEAQATGTPVIAFNRGAAPEVIQDGKTGFVVDTFADLVAKIKEVGTIKRSTCHEFVNTHFSISTMISGYERAYTQTISNWTKLQKKQQTHLKKW